MLDEAKRYFKIDEKTIKKFPENNIDTTFSQPLEWILCEGRFAINFIYFFSKIYHRVAQKSDGILQKKFIKKYLCWKRFY